MAHLVGQSLLEPKVLEVATRIATPLGYAGLVVAALFLIFRQLLARDVFPRLTVGVGGKLLRQMVDRLFILALVATILGFAVHFFSPKATPEPALPTEQDGRLSLERLYRGDFEATYEDLPAVLKAQWPYVKFAGDLKATFSQFSGPPIFRHFRSHEELDGRYYMTFESEFDEVSRFRERLTYTSSEGQWVLWYFEISPVEWPATPAMEVLPARTASELRSILAGTPPPGLEGRWIPLPGWNANVARTENSTGARTCDVRLLEVGSGVPIVARRVLDGCRLSEGQRLTLVGRLDHASVELIEVAAVRFWRST